MRATAAGLTDVGLQREHNEDSYVVLGVHDLFVVADGMGGHQAGDVASQLATETVGEFFERTSKDDNPWPFQRDPQLSEEENRLVAAIRMANRQIYARSTSARELRGMGTTFVGALFSGADERMYVGHVGDSRAYRVRDGEIAQLTRDHSLFNDYLAAMPDMSEEQQSELPKNVITRALGMQDSVEVDILSDVPSVGDVYVLCSDGLSGMITDEEIRDVVVGTTDLDEMCRRMVMMANEHGGEDNITVVVVRIEEGSDVRDSMNTEIPSTQPMGIAGGTVSKAPPRVDPLAQTPRDGIIMTAPTFDEEGPPSRPSHP